MKVYSDRPCKLYYDTDHPPCEGEYVLSMSSATGEPTGNAYRIQSVRKVKSEKNPHRYNLVCLRCHISSIPEGAVRLPLFWYSRNRKKEVRRE